MNKELVNLCECKRNKVISAIEENKIIVIIRGLKGETLYKTAQAIYDGGIRVMEITFVAT